MKDATTCSTTVSSSSSSSSNSSYDCRACVMSSSSNVHEDDDDDDDNDDEEREEIVSLQDDSINSCCSDHHHHQPHNQPQDSKTGLMSFQFSTSTWNIKLIFLFILISLSLLDYLIIKNTTRTSFLFQPSRKNQYISRVSPNNNFTPFSTRTTVSLATSANTNMIQQQDTNHPHLLLVTTVPLSILPTSIIDNNKKKRQTNKNKKNTWIQQQQQQEVDSSTVSTSVSHNNKNDTIIRNMKVLLSAVGIEVIIAILLKCLFVPNVPLTSLLAGLITTRRIRFLSKIKQLLFFISKIAKFEKRFKKLTLALKTIQKGGLCSSSTQPSSSSIPSSTTTSSSTSTKKNHQRQQEG